MTKKILVWLLATVFLATVSPAGAQQPKKVAKIGVLLPSTSVATAHLLWRSGKGCGSMAMSKIKASSWSPAMATARPNDFRSSRVSW